MPWYEGSCRITVIGVEADWPQRVVVSIRRGATVVIPGTLGSSQVIDGDCARHGWDLAVEHRYDGVWRPNVRAVQGKWTETNGVRTQVIRSKDHDWPGDTRERNLVLRLERTDSPVRAPEPVVTARRVSTESTRRAATESTRPATTESTSPREWDRGVARRTTATEGQVAPAVRVVTTSGGSSASD